LPTGLAFRIIASDGSCASRLIVTDNNDNEASVHTARTIMRAMIRVGIGVHAANGSAQTHDDGNEVNAGLSFRVSRLERYPRASRASRMRSIWYHPTLREITRPLRYVRPRLTSWPPLQPDPRSRRRLEIVLSLTLIKRSARVSKARLSLAGYELSRSNVGTSKRRKRFFWRRSVG
jgi:hypothetical protein